MPWTMGDAIELDSGPAALFFDLHDSYLQPFLLLGEGSVTK